MNRNKFKYTGFLLVDLLALFLSFCLAYYIYFKNLNSLLNSEEYRTLLSCIILIGICTYALSSRYSRIYENDYLKEIKSLLVNIVYIACLLSLYLFSTKTSVKFSRVTIYLTFVIYFFLDLLFRFILRKIIIFKNEIYKEKNNRVIIITTNKELKNVIKNIKNNNFNNYLIDSIYVTDKNVKEKDIEGIKVKTNINNLLSYICHTWIDEILIATNTKNVPKELFEGFATAGITTNVVIKPIKEFNDRKFTVNKLFNYTVATTSIAARSDAEQFTKRLMDIVGGLVGCLITLLLTIIIGPIIFIKSPGPIFYKQERIGQNGRRFKMYKFRSMVLNADDLKASLQKKNRIKDGMMFKIENDPRIIPGIGNFIRNTSLDEFPQFINVLKGDMSLVGTRPPTVDEWEKYKLEHRIRMAIKPGITGLWQTNGRSKITDFNKVIEYDTKYINEWSLSLDIEILIKTIVVLLSKRDKEEAM